MHDNRTRIFIQLIDDLANVKEGKMFGFHCIKTANGKDSAMFWKDNLIVKFQDKMLEDALKLNEAKLF